MGLATDIRKKIERKTILIVELEAQKDGLEMQIREASAAIQAYQEILKITPPDAGGTEKAEPNLRTGSLPALARIALQKHGSAMHVAKLLEAMAKPATQENRLALSSSLGSYAKANKIFTRPEANTFGLLEWDIDQASVDETVDRVAQVSSK